MTLTRLCFPENYFRKGVGKWFGMEIEPAPTCTIGWLLLVSHLTTMMEKSISIRHFCEVKLPRVVSCYLFPYGLDLTHVQ